MDAGATSGAWPCRKGANSYDGRRKPSRDESPTALSAVDGVVSSREDVENLIRRGDEAAQSLKRSIVEQGFAPEEDE